MIGRGKNKSTNQSKSLLTMKKIIKKKNFSHILLETEDNEWILTVAMGGVADVLNSFRLTKHEIAAIKNDDLYLHRLVQAIKEVSASFRDREVKPAILD
jgi:hypothetical protein